MRTTPLTLPESGERGRLAVLVASTATLLLSSACKPPENGCTNQLTRCGPIGTCRPNPLAPEDPNQITCACTDGTFVDPSVSVCAATFASISVNGVAVELADATGLTVVDLPAGATTLDVHATAATPQTHVLIEGQAVEELQLPWTPPLTKVTVALAATTGQVVTSVQLIVRVGVHFDRVAGFVGGGLGVALAGDGHTLAVGSLGAGMVRVWTEADAGWQAPQSLSGGGYFGWTVALAEQGEVLAVSCTAGFQQPCAGPGLRMFRRQAAGFAEEPAVPEPGEPRLAIDAAGQTVWAALGASGAVAFGRDGGTWERVAALAGPASSVAVSGDGRVVAVGSQDDATLRLFAPADGGWVQTGLLQGDGGFGSSVSLSRDATVLVVSARSASPLTAWIYEQAGGVWQPRLELHPAISPALAVSGSVDFQVPVACSLDGQTAAVGFPVDRSVVVAQRGASGWSVLEAVVPHGHAQFGLFGNGVALSADGRRLAVSAPGADVDLTVHDRGR